MSLQTKFAVLVLVILTAVAGSLWAAVWSFRLLETESGRPAEAAGVLKRLDSVERLLDGLNPELNPPKPVTSTSTPEEHPDEGDKPRGADPARTEAPHTPNYAGIARDLADATRGLDTGGAL